MRRRRVIPVLHTRVCDVAEMGDRVELARWATLEFPALDVLVNNAGIQQRVQLAHEPEWTRLHNEIETNFEAPVHLTPLLVPHLSAKPRAAILNVTSGLAFVPLTAAPIYSATKAAMRSFTLSLRQQLEQTPVEVIEIIPPAVNSDLGGPGLHTWDVPLDEFADAVFSQLRAGRSEVAYQFSLEALRASADERDAMFQRLNKD